MCKASSNKLLISNHFQSADIKCDNTLSKRKLCSDNPTRAKKSRLIVTESMSQATNKVVEVVESKVDIAIEIPKMVTTFAQAAKSAKIHYMERFGTTVFKNKRADKKVELNLDFCNMNSSLDSMSVSDKSSASYSSPGHLPIMEPLNLSIEQDLSVNLSVLDLSGKAKPNDDSSK